MSLVLSAWGSDRDALMWMRISRYYREDRALSAYKDMGIRKFSD